MLGIMGIHRRFWIGRNSLLELNQSENWSVGVHLCGWGYYEVRNLHTGNTPGVDEICLEILKALDKLGVMWHMSLQCHGSGDDTIQELNLGLWRSNLGFIQVWNSLPVLFFCISVRGQRSSLLQFTCILWIWRRYDRVPWHLSTVLQEYTVCALMLCAIQSLKEGSKSYICILGVKSNMNVRFLQGSTLSPLLFVLLFAVFTDRI